MAKAKATKGNKANPEKPVESAEQRESEDLAEELTTEESGGESDDSGKSEVVAKPASNPVKAVNKTKKPADKPVQNVEVR